MADDTNIACGTGKEGQFNLHGSAPVVDITTLWTKFGRTVVHQDLNLEIERGEILSIVGGSGTGKTVLLRQMLGLEHPARRATGSRRQNCAANPGRCHR